MIPKKSLLVITLLSVLPLTPYLGAEEEELIVSANILEETVLAIDGEEETLAAAPAPAPATSASSTATETANPPPLPYTIVPDQNVLKIKTPSLSQRRTAKMRFTNGLEVYLISDPAADKSAAAMAVNVGSWSEPTEIPGLAHFLEHMLFLGNSKYPSESEYHRFIKEHGGETNAYTTTDHTEYAFAVNNDAFEPALNRFSWFFKEPLFNQSGVDREMHAVDQEFSQNLDDDHVRELQVYKELASPAHPHSRFTMGNLVSLQNVTQDALKRFYEEHYSANLMHLVVYSSLPLDRLEALVAADFADIPNRNKKPLKLTVPAFSNEYQGKMVYISPIKNVRTLSIMWELPSSFANQLQLKPEDLVSYIIGHEGQGSLLASLKKEGLAENLASGGFHPDANTLFFFIDVSLTDEGLAQRDTVIERIFQTIALLKAKGVPSYIFDEMQKMHMFKYEYQSREDAFDFVENLASDMLYEKFETFPQHTKVIDKFDPQLANDFIAELKPQKAIYAILAPSELTSVSPERNEKWMGIAYSVQPIPEKQLTGWARVTPVAGVTLPAPNPFIPKNLTLLPSDAVAAQDKALLPHPEAIVSDDNFGTVFYAQDARFKVPEVACYFTIKTPQVDPGDPLRVVLADLYTRCVNENLNAISYQAQLAGLKFDIVRGDDSIQLVISGYSENVPMLFDKIIAEMKAGFITDENFKIYQASLLREYENAQREPPLTQGKEMLRSLLYKEFVTDRQKATAIGNISYDQLIAYNKSIFDNTFLEATIYGNVSNDTAMKMWRAYRKVIGGDAFPRSQQRLKEIVVLPPERGPYYISKKVDVEGNAVLLMIQNGPFSFKNRAAHQILGTSLQAPFFNDLRTLQQTGYIVASNAQELERQLFNVFAVQSATYNVRDLLARFELFLDLFLRQIDQGQEAIDQFNTVRQSSITALETPPKNLGEMTELLNLLAFQYDADFDWYTKRIEGLKNLTFHDYLAFADASFGRQNHRRCGFFIKGRIPDEVAMDYRWVRNVSTLRKHSSFFSREDIIAGNDPWDRNSAANETINAAEVLKLSIQEYRQAPAQDIANDQDISDDEQEAITQETNSRTRDLPQSVPGQRIMLYPIGD